MRVPRSSRRPARRGLILLVVVALLTLFAIIGLTFVFVANSQETSARIAREAETQRHPDFDGELALAQVLGQMIYDVNDDATGVYSGLRGHSLARMMYGYMPGVHNDRAFCGAGHFHFSSPLGGSDPIGSDDAYLVNYQYFPNDGFLRDPERYGSRTSLGAAPGAFCYGLNVPFTYPDHHNFFLAYQDAPSGQILLPSFHREYLFGRLDSASNPNWTNVQGKYLTPRPRPFDVDPTGAGGFPYPADRGGDVKNLDWAPGGNDSIWIDPGLPVQIAADGRKYKVLVAPLVLDLDSRVNLNVAGNLVGNPAGANKTSTPRPVGATSVHVSNQGWGPWEVNPALVLNYDTVEWKNLFYGSSPTGTPHVPGRYGANRIPSATPQLLWQPATSPYPAPRGWAAIDFNGLDESTGIATATPYELPGSGTNSPLATYPLFSPNRYGQGTTPPSTPWASEQVDHPRGYNPMVSAAAGAAADTRVLPIHAMHQLLRYGSTNGDFVTSDLLRLLPNNLGAGSTTATAAAALERRNQVTLASFDLDRPATMPYVFDPNDSTAYFTLSTSVTPPQPLSPQTSIPDLPSQRPTAPTGSEYDPTTWRSTLASMSRLNLNRSLTPFPPPDSTGACTNPTQAAQALADRQKFASDIFNLLCEVCGTQTPATAYALTIPGGQSPQYQAIRYLAQLSANIVDYIDTDDQSTPFNWYNPPGAAPEWVFGTEYPRLLINEAYAQYDNDPADPRKVGAAYEAGNPYHVNVWVEMFNPFLADPVSSTTQDTTARLQVNNAAAQPLYQVLVVNPAATTSTLSNPANTAGNPDFQLTAPTTNIYGTVNSFGTTDATRTVQPMPAPSLTPPSQGNVGFYVLGPQFTFLTGQSPETPPRTYAANPNLTSTLTSTGMSYSVPLSGAPAVGGVTPVVLLQRLACPLMPYNNSPTSPTYNPYITIDSFAFQAKQVNDARYFLSTGINVPSVLTARQSYGRSQPFANTPAQTTAQTRANTNQPQHTFYSHNTSLKIPFFWHTHLDRNLISPMELLFVHSARPMDFTPYALDTSGNLNQARYAAWLNGSSRLYRFLEFVSTPSLASGVIPGGRIPGRININGIWQPEVFSALCDPQLGNTFAATDVTTVFNQMLQQRSTNSMTFSGTTFAVPGPTDYLLANAANSGGVGVSEVVGGQWKQDRPFWSYGIGYSTDIDYLPFFNPVEYSGLDNTLLRPTTFQANSGARTLGVPSTTATHPYQQMELLNKISNSTTTRSNVFAVFLTVGFFTVTDDTKVPVQLGAEVGRSENRQVRHRMFAIVDRSNLTAFSTTSLAATTPTGSSTSLPLVPVLPSGTNPNTGATWTLQPGMFLTFEPNTSNEETVVVQTGNLASFKLTHPKGCTVVNRGNPGPWLRYDPRQDGGVVPYFAIID